MKFEPDRIISDFESGMIATVKKQVSFFNLVNFFFFIVSPFQLPNTIHQGCLFHLYQNLTKQMKKVGLWTHYKNNDALHLFIKKIMAIVLLKPILMDNAYQFLFNQYLKEKRLKRFIVQLTKFMFYFQKQWMKPKIRKMLSFYDVDFKTNNWSESNNRKSGWSLCIIFFNHFRLQRCPTTTSTTKPFIYLDIISTFDHRRNWCTNETFSIVKWKNKNYKKTCS